MILAPLTRGGNLPFRRLCADFGCEVTVGEMVFARYLVRGKGDKIELARLRRAANEQFFGVQIATNDIEEGVKATMMAADAGADWVDLNCGCPIYEATRRNLGSALLRYPEKLARLVAGIAAGSPLPLSVKVRVASEGGDVNVREVCTKLREAGAAAVTIHGRTAEARYSRAADWQLIAQCVADNNDAGGTMPIVGNGDILTHYEARQRMALSGVDGVMVGRGALTKPWIFQEFKSGELWTPSAVERVEVYRRLAQYMKEHFRDDARGRKSAFYFLPWHFDFLTRYKPLPETEYAESARQTPLMQTRFAPLPPDAPPLERLLAHSDPRAHQLIANALWEAQSDAEAVRSLTALAEGDELAALGRPDDGALVEDAELANIPDSERKSGSGAGGQPRKQQRKSRRPQPIQRTEEEIAAIRAERAAKRERLGTPPHVDGSGRRKADAARAQKDPA